MYNSLGYEWAYLLANSLQPPYVVLLQISICMFQSVTVHNILQDKIFCLLHSIVYGQFVKLERKINFNLSTR